jgi:predicted RecB family nuclease
MTDPQNIETIDDLATQAKMRIESVTGLRDEISDSIDLNYEASEETEKQISQLAAPVSKLE